MILDNAFPFAAYDFKGNGDRANCAGAGSWFFFFVLCRFSFSTHGILLSVIHSDLYISSGICIQPNVYMLFIAGGY